MKKSDIRNEINGALDFYMYEYGISKEDAKIPTAEMYIYLYLQDGIDANELVEILDELRDNRIVN